MHIHTSSGTTKTAVGRVLWSSVTEAGFFSGVFATIMHLLDIHGYSFVVFFLIILVVLSITIFNLRLFHIIITRKPFVEYIDGHEESFEYLVPYVKNAKKNIWVTRFSRGSISQEHDYFSWTSRRIIGDGCQPIDTYRRVMNIDSKDKAELVCEMLQKAGKSNHFFLRKTQLFFPFEILIIDEKDGFFLFHEPGSTGTITSVLMVSHSGVVQKMREIYQAIWDHERTDKIKDGVLTDEEISNLVDEYHTVEQSLAV